MVALAPGVIRTWRSGEWTKECTFKVHVQFHSAFRKSWRRGDTLVIPAYCYQRREGHLFSPLNCLMGHVVWRVTAASMGARQRVEDS